ncbi:hypothetical protein [Arachidicoccus ginsenosidivorans]|nr:hypothetical protein [Arachidicoccus ginsenosidivorans]
MESLDWQIRYDLDEMMRTAWAWEKKMSVDGRYTNQEKSVLN